MIAISNSESSLDVLPPRVPPVVTDRSPNDNICSPPKKEKEKKKENSDTTSKQREVLLSFPSYKPRTNILLDEGEDETTVTVPSHFTGSDVQPTRLCMTVLIKQYSKRRREFVKYM